MRRSAAALCLLASLAACATVPRSAADAPLTVLVFNIHAGKDAKNVDNLERVASLVKETGADVVLLQEVDRNTTRSGKVDQPAVLERLTGFHAVLGKSLDYQGGDYGIAVLSRWPIARWDAHRLPVEPPQLRSGVYEPRTALVTTIETPWGPLGVVNTHLDAGGPDVYRRQEVRTVLAVVDSLKASGLTVLAGGDFNSTPESAVQQQARAGGLRDAFAECGSGDGLSYPEDKPTKRIDYLFLTGSARCERAEVLANYASDHRPVLFRVRVR